MGLAVLALLVAVVAIALMLWGNRQQRAAGLPAGRVVYADAKPVGVPEKPIYDRELGLVGKPDYLVAAPDAKGALVPVEVKSAWAPSEPHEGHVFQLLAYCLLVERSTGTRPPYGLLRYRNRTFAIDFTRQAEQELLAVLEEMRSCERKKDLPRSHEDPHRCNHCGYRSICDEKLE